MRKSISFYVFVMLENISDIREFVKVLDRGKFMRSDVTQDAVMWCVTKVAQATGSVPAEVRTRSPDVPWVMMEAMREVLEDEHLNVDLELLWGVVTEDLLPLESRLKVILADLEEEEGYSG